MAAEVEADAAGRGVAPVAVLAETVVPAAARPTATPTVPNVPVAPRRNDMVSRIDEASRQRQLAGASNRVERPLALRFSQTPQALIVLGSQ